MKPAIAIAISGGIDSLVAAYLLRRQGYRVVGLHFFTGYEDLGTRKGVSTQPPGQSNHATNHCEDVTGAFRNHPVAHIGRQLNIPVFFADCRNIFQSRVVEYFCHTYSEGRTPNPCLVCNAAIKFGVLLSFAKSKGAVALATGHYAQVHKADNGYHLHKGVDTIKDQSYFLSFLTQEQLSHAYFPLGTLTKQKVRHIALENHLTPIETIESQDVCFIQDQSYGEFLSHRGNINTAPGPIADTHGNIIGEHKGLHLFTIGQRRGINCPASEPYYVVGIDPQKNRLTVGGKKDLYANGCRITNINWIQKPIAGEFTVDTKLRYRHRAVPATVRIGASHTAKLRFHSPQSAITPGQGAVLYKEDEVLGGGWIEK